eukprot:Nk52_evm13s914 gene=Nk52_evmTU13s914
MSEVRKRAGKGGEAKPEEQEVVVAEPPATIISGTVDPKKFMFVLLLCFVIVGTSTVVSYNKTGTFVWGQDMQIRKSLLDKYHYVRGMKNMRLEDLAQYNGENGYPIYVSLLGKVYDVQGGEKHYGKNGPYHMLAGKEITRFLTLATADDLATMEVDVDNPFDGVTEEHFESLKRWILLFERHGEYARVGTVPYARRMVVDRFGAEYLAELETV